MRRARARPWRPAARLTRVKPHVGPAAPGSDGASRLWTGLDAGWHGRQASRGVGAAAPFLIVHLNDGGTCDIVSLDSHSYISAC